MTTAQAHILGMVGTIRRRWTTREITSAAAWTVAGVAMWLLWSIVIDNLAMLPPAGLMMAWLVLLGGLAWWGARLLSRIVIHPPSDVNLALLHERRTSDRQTRLVSSVEFIRTGLSDRDPAALAAVQENAQHLDPATAHLAVDARPIKRSGLFAGLALALLALYFLVAPAWAANGLARLMSPFGPAAHLLAADIRVTPGSVELVEGGKVIVHAYVNSRTPADAAIEYRMKGSGWTTAPMKRAPAVDRADASVNPTERVPYADAEHWTYEGFSAVWQPMEYRVRAGRSVTATYTIAVSVRPRVEHVQVETTAPAYAGGLRSAGRADVGDVTALAGSTAAVALTATSDLQWATLELSDGRVLPMSIDPRSLRVARASFAVSPGLTHYVVKLIDPTGNQNAQPIRYTLTPLTDQPPLATIVQPGRDLSLPADAGIELAIQAEDDVGLGKVALQARTSAPDSQWREISVWTMNEPTIRSKGFSAPLDLSKHHLKVGDTLMYRVTATDRCEPKANTYVGRTWSIIVSARSSDTTLVRNQTKQLLDLMRQILALQKDNRTNLDMDRDIPPMRVTQDKVRQLTLAAIEQQRTALRPDEKLLGELSSLADGLMARAIDMLGRYGGTFQQRLPHKAPILAVMDQIIARLETLVNDVNRSLDLANKAQEALNKLPASDREEALKNIRSMLEKLRAFGVEQDKTIQDAQELARKAPDLTKDDLQKLERAKGTEDKWDKVFTASTQDIKKLAEQGFADQTIANDYKEMVEQIEEASKNMNPKQVTMAVPAAQAGRELAEELKKDMEMWLPNSPDNVKWVMEEPPTMPEIPMAKLPDQLADMIGDLMKQEEALQEMADDQTSAWADSMSAAGWGVSDGPISNFSAKGVTGNQLPNNQELNGRAGEGRTGKSNGQFVQDVARGLDGRKTPTRITNDPYEKGVVKELQQTATSGATGGGKARGSGQDGLQGSSPPPLYDKLQVMKDWQQRIRQQAEQVAGQLQTIHVRSIDLEKAIELMKKAEQSGKDGRYADLVKTQQMVLQQLKVTADSAIRDSSMRVDRASGGAQRHSVLDAGDEPVPQEYRDAVRRYFENLSQDK